MTEIAYLAARYIRWPELQDYRDELSLYGIDVISRWIEGAHECKYPDNPNYVSSFNAMCATDDIDDIKDVDLFICFTETPTQFTERPTGGRHVELGMAIAWEKEIHVIGPQENVFYFLPHIDVWDSWQDFMDNFVKINFDFQAKELMES